MKHIKLAFATTSVCEHRHSGLAGRLESEARQAFSDASWPRPFREFADALTRKRQYFYKLQL